MAAAAIGRSMRIRLRSLRVALPLKPPIEPQLALSRKQIPEGEGWATSRSTTAFGRWRSSTGPRSSCSRAAASRCRRYFPELSFPEGRYVIDGELVILGDDGARGVRRAPEPDPPGRVAGEDAGRADAGAVSRLRPARGGRRKLLGEPFSERRAALRSWSRASGRGPRVGRADAAGQPTPTRPSPGWRPARA